MKKFLTIINIIVLGLYSSISFADPVSDIQIKANVEKGCSLRIAGDYDFGVLDFTQPSSAIVINNYATHKELDFKLDLLCSKGTGYNLNYDTETRPALNSTVMIQGILLNNVVVSNPDFLVAYIYVPELSRNLHSNGGINDVFNYNSMKTYDWYLGVQNPLLRGYTYPTWGDYKGESLLSVTF